MWKYNYFISYHLIVTWPYYCTFYNWIHMASTNYYHYFKFLYKDLSAWVNGYFHISHLNIINTLRKKWERHICACKCLMQALSLYRDSAWHVHVCLSSEFPYRVCAMSLVPSPSRRCNILIESCLILSVCFCPCH